MRYCILRYKTFSQKASFFVVCAKMVSLEARFMVKTSSTVEDLVYPSTIALCIYYFQTKISCLLESFRALKSEENLISLTADERCLFFFLIS